ncbi:MAG TPA: hypothetical protein VFZ63_10210 [Jiangellaceae bacterium]
MNTERLLDELRGLGRSVQSPPVDTEALTARTMAALDSPVQAAATPRPRIARRRWRAFAGAVAAVMIVLALTPPVRAAVVDWFGVVITSGPAVENQPVPPAESSLSMVEARKLVNFEPIQPWTLGPPDGVEVSPDGMVLSMTWSAAGGGVTRMDQFIGVAPTYLKEFLYAAEQIDLGSTTALWFDGPHQVTRIDEAGREQVETARSAGPTLIVPIGDLTIRIEGLDRDRAVEVARSITGTD